jgi:hypothetical protein
MNVNKVLQGYQFPLTTEKVQEEIPGVLAPSALQQIAGLGTLIGSTFGQTVNPKTGELMNTGAGYKGLDLVKDLYGGVKSFFPSSGTDLQSADEIAQGNSMMNFPG